LLTFVSGRAVTAGLTYPIGGISNSGPGTAGLPGAVMQATKPGTSLGWTSGSGTASVGSYTITSISGNRMTGTFTATLTGSGGALAISAAFDVRIDTP
jgi:hypothetical protein